jgi:hypothetical protein
VVGGLVADEVPIIARRGESILTPAQMKGLANAGQAPSGGGNHVQVNVVNNANGTTVETQKRRQGNVDVHDIIVRTVNDHAASGGLDGVMKARFNTAVQPRAR